MPSLTSHQPSFSHRTIWGLVLTHIHVGQRTEGVPGTLEHPFAGKSRSPSLRRHRSGPFAMRRFTPWGFGPLRPLQFLHASSAPLGRPSATRVRDAALLVVHLQRLRAKAAASVPRGDHGATDGRGRRRPRRRGRDPWFRDPKNGGQVGRALHLVAETWPVLARDLGGWGWRWLGPSIRCCFGKWLGGALVRYSELITKEATKTPLHYALLCLQC